MTGLAGSAILILAVFMQETGKIEAGNFCWAVYKKGHMILKHGRWITVETMRSSCFTWWNSWFSNLQWFKSRQCIFLFLEERAKMNLISFNAKEKVWNSMPKKPMSKICIYIWTCYISPLILKGQKYIRTSRHRCLVWSKKSALPVTFIPGISILVELSSWKYRFLISVHQLLVAGDVSSEQLVLLMTCSCFVLPLDLGRALLWGLW